jgi:hypothetical protein
MHGIDFIFEIPQRAHNGGQTGGSSQTFEFTPTSQFHRGCLLFCVCPAMGQAKTGELRLKATDSSAAGFEAVVTVMSQRNQDKTVLTTDAEGMLLSIGCHMGFIQLRPRRNTARTRFQHQLIPRIIGLAGMKTHDRYRAAP